MLISQLKNIQLTDAQLEQIHVLFTDRARQLLARFADPAVSLIEREEVGAELVTVTSVLETVAQA